MQEEFTLLDHTTGRLKRGLVISGNVNNPMSLREFPLDTETSEVSLSSNSRWSTLNFALGGEIPAGELYMLHRVEDPSEGHFHVLAVHPSMLKEWVLCGYSHSVVRAHTQASSQVKTVILLRYHLARMPAFYVFKVLVPLYMLAIFGFRTFFYDVADVENRDANTTTMFLSSFAVLYVVSDLLPKGIRVLTKIDLVVLATLTTLLLASAESLVVERLQRSSPLLARELNMALGGALAAGYVALNVLIFLPSWWRYNNELKRLRVSRPLDNEPGAQGQSRYVAVVESGDQIQSTVSAHRASAAFKRWEEQDEAEANAEAEAKPLE